MVQNVQVSTGIRDRQIYQTLQKMSKGLGKAVRFVELASGTQAVTDASGTNGAGAINVDETIVVDTGYTFTEAQLADKFDFLTARVYDPSYDSLTGSVGFEDGRFLIDSDRNVQIVFDVISGPGSYSWVNLEVKWVLFEIKP